MKKVTIYTTNWCGYCHRAKRVLAGHGVPFVEVDVTDSPDQRRWLLEKTGSRTVPQIFFDEQSVGGCTDLEDIVRRGKLDELLGRSKPAPSA